MLTLGAKFRVKSLALLYCEMRKVKQNEYSNIFEHEKQILEHQILVSFPALYNGNKWCSDILI